MKSRLIALGGVWGALLSGCVLDPALEQDEAPAQDIGAVFEVGDPLVAPEPGAQDDLGHLTESPRVFEHFRSGQHRYHRYHVPEGTPLVRVRIEANFAPALRVRTKIWRADVLGMSSSEERFDWVPLVNEGYPDSYEVTLLRDRDQPLDLYLTSEDVHRKGGGLVSPNAAYAVQLINFGAVRTFCGTVDTTTRWSGSESDLFDDDPATAYELAYSSRARFAIKLGECGSAAALPVTAFVTSAEVRLSSDSPSGARLEYEVQDSRFAGGGATTSQSFRYVRAEGDDRVYTYLTEGATRELSWAFGDDANTDFLWTYEDASIRDVTIRGLLVDELSMYNTVDVRVPVVAATP